MTGTPSLASRAETVPLKAMGRSQHDQRTAEQFSAALWRETDRSLREDSSRWAWTSTTGRLSSASRQV